MQTARLMTRSVRLVRSKRLKTVVCPSVRMSVPSIDSSSGARGFAAEVGRVQQKSIDSCCCRTTCGRVIFGPIAGGPTYLSRCKYAITCTRVNFSDKNSVRIRRDPVRYFHYCYDVVSRPLALSLALAGA